MTPGVLETADFSRSAATPRSPPPERRSTRLQQVIPKPEEWLGTSPSRGLAAPALTDMLDRKRTSGILTGWYPDPPAIDEAWLQYHEYPPAPPRSTSVSALFHARGVKAYLAPTHADPEILIYIRPLTVLNLLYCSLCCPQARSL